MNFTSAFDFDLKDGQEAETEVHKILTKESGLAEVKNDYKTHITGNIAVEYESRSKPSGIMVTKSKWWISRIDRTGTIIILDAVRLRLYCERMIRDGFVREGGDDNTSKLVLIPTSEIHKI